MEERNCQNGHAVESGFDFCPRCGLPASTNPADPNASAAVRGEHLGTGPAAEAGTSTVPSVAASTADSPRSRRSQGWLLAGGALAAVLLVIVALVTAGGSSGPVSAKDAPAAGAGADAGRTPEPLTKAEVCEGLVMDLLADVPDALNDGYPAGIDMDPVMYEYGSTSPEFQTAVTAQGHLISQIIMHGDPYGQVEKMRRPVQQGCRGEYMDVSAN